MLGSSIGLVALGHAGGLDVFWTGLLLMVTLIDGFLALWSYYVCPQCGEVPLTEWKRTGTGFKQYLDLNPARCRKCGARLT